MKIPPAAVAVAPGKTPIVGFLYIVEFLLNNRQSRPQNSPLLDMEDNAGSKGRSVATPRLKSKMYCINTFGLLLPFSVTAILNFIYRLAYIDNQGHCTIGVKLASLLPLIIFDCVMNLVLTTQFVIPLRRQLSYRTGEDSIIRQVTIRSFVGSVCTLTSSVVNLSVLLSLDGEQAWICLLCCNADILFSVMMLHWVTSKDSGTSSKIAFSKKARQSGLPSNKGSQWAKLAYGPNLEQSKVVTQVEARVGKRVDPGNESDDIGVDEYEMGKIRVRTGHVVTVEEIKVEDEEIGRNNSEEDLVVKT
ncbi:hypothetical protein B7494_g291 [Chlorociboria aeruginascens]|nr:hypothetical protein B7494_g291 [Chlorociboria aeruginascens]